MPEVSLLPDESLLPEMSLLPDNSLVRNQTSRPVSDILVRNQISRPESDISRPDFSFLSFLPDLTDLAGVPAVLPLGVPLHVHPVHPAARHCHDPLPTS